MMVIKFDEEILTPKGFDGRKFVPILDSEDTIDALITRLEELKKKYRVRSVFIAGDAIVGSVADKGDYTCLCAEVM